MDSGPQENWTGHVCRGRQKGSATQQQGSSRLSQPRARVLRGQRPEATEEGDSSPAESDSSDQGEATAPSCLLLPQCSTHKDKLEKGRSEIAVEVVKEPNGHQ